MKHPHLPRFVPALACAALIAAAASGLAEEAPAKPAGIEGVEVTVQATVTAVDQENRRVTIEDAEGNEVVLELGEEVRNLPQVEVGDRVVAEYFRGMVFQVEPAGSGKPMRAEQTRVERARPGQKPGAHSVKLVEIVARVEAVDQGERMVTLRGPKAALTLPVADDVDLTAVQTGDMVKVEFVESVTIGVVQP
jgi:hypothetical protein